MDGVNGLRVGFRGDKKEFIIFAKLRFPVLSRCKLACMDFENLGLGIMIVKSQVDEIVGATGLILKVILNLTSTRYGSFSIDAPASETGQVWR
jgi:hypothetical protein